MNEIFDETRGVEKTIHKHQHFTKLCHRKNQEQVYFKIKTVLFAENSQILFVTCIIYKQHMLLKSIFSFITPFFFAIFIII